MKQLATGTYYVVQYVHQFKDIPLQSFENTTYESIHTTLEEAKKVYERELSMNHYKKIEELEFKPTDEEYDKHSFNLGIDRLTVDEEGDKEYETVVMSEQDYYDI